MHCLGRLLMCKHSACKGNASSACIEITIAVLSITERPWNESLSAKIAKVQEAFKNIPPMLYFAPSSVIYDGVGVYAAEQLPQGNDWAGAGVPRRALE